MPAAALAQQLLEPYFHPAAGSVAGCSSRVLLLQSWCRQQSMAAPTVCLLCASLQDGAIAETVTWEEDEAGGAGTRHHIIDRWGARA